MLYEELHERYGRHIATRIQIELSPSEFKQAAIAKLLNFLEKRAEDAHREYQVRVNNPFINEELGAARAEYIDKLYYRWREAEDLAYLLSVAEDVGNATRLAVAASKA